MAEELMSNIEKAISLFNQGYNCSQSILATYWPQFGLDENSAFKIACGFGGGMAQQGNSCGAVSGAFMVLGLKHGNTDVEDTNAKLETNELVQEFTKHFIARHNTTKCNDLLGYDISSPEDLQIMTEKDLFSTLCPGFVKDAADILEELLKEQK